MMEGRAPKQRTDISDLVKQIASRLGLDESYIARLDIEPLRVTVLLHKGRDGLCQGAKYIDPETQASAMETLEFEVLA